MCAVFPSLKSRLLLYFINKGLDLRFFFLQLLDESGLVIDIFFSVA